MPKKITKTVTIRVLCNLDQIAAERNLKPYDIAAMSGLSVPAIYDLISNRSSPNMQTLTKLAIGLGVTHAELLRTEMTE